MKAKKIEEETKGFTTFSLFYFLTLEDCICLKIYKEGERNLNPFISELVEKNTSADDWEC